LINGLNPIAQNAEKKRESNNEDPLFYSDGYWIGDLLREETRCAGSLRVLLKFGGTAREWKSDGTIKTLFLIRPFPLNFIKSSKMP